MVLFSLLLKRKINRTANVVAGVLAAAIILFTPPSDLDDTFFLIIELSAIGAILWTAWKWTSENQKEVVI